MNILHWIKGFLTNKNTLSEEDTKILKEEVDKELSTEYYPAVNLPFTNVDTCKYPMDCGLPKVWYGIIPPVCNKCGYQSPQWTITSTNTNG